MISDNKLEIKTNPANRWAWILVPILIFAGIGLRFLGLDFMSMDIRDFLLEWYNQLVTNGFAALRYPFSNYTPPYLYLLFIGTKTADFIPRIAAIKLLSICFDFLNSFLVYKILKIKYPHGVVAWIGAALFLILPTILLNSAYWGQSDAIYTFFLIACLFFLMKDQPFSSMIFLGVSFSFKAQAAFLGPLVLLLIIRKKIPWHYSVIIPLVYVLMMIPAALAGRSMIELLTVYIGQADTYHRLSEHAPNLYLFVSNTLYSPVLVIGLLMTVLITLTWITIYARKIKEFTPQTILFCALVSAAFMPFFLPKMHDRYFYVAEVLSFLVAFYFPGTWLLAVIYQFVSGLVYAVVLRASVMPVEPILAGNALILAAFVNTALMGFVFWIQWKLVSGNAGESLNQRQKHLDLRANRFR